MISPTLCFGAEVFRELLRKRRFPSGFEPVSDLPENTPTLELVSICFYYG